MEGTMGRRTVLLIAALVVAALGTTMVFLYVNGVNDRALAKQNPYKVLVAKKPIEPGTTVKQADNAASFGTKVISKDALVPGAVSAVTGLTGTVATTRIFPGQQIIQPMFGDSTGSTSTLPVPADMVGMSISMADPAQTAGFVSPGDHVAIFLTTTTKGGQAQSQILLPSVKVLAVGSETGVPQDPDTTSGTDGSVPKSILTIALDQKDVQRVLVATKSGGQLNLGLPGSKFTASPTVGATNQSDLSN
jgi:pilus assembly protein CpaB